jgi:hypothetical protein
MSIVLVVKHNMIIVLLLSKLFSAGNKSRAGRSGVAELGPTAVHISAS